MFHQKICHAMTLLLMFLLFNNIAQAQTNMAISNPTTKTFLLTDQGPDMMALWPKYFKLHYQKGRILLLALKKGIVWSKVPEELQMHLTPMGRDEVRSIESHELEPAAPGDPRLAQYLDGISRDRLVDVIERMSAKESRLVGKPGNIEVAAWLKQLFQTYLGLNVTEQCFSPATCNIVAVKRGAIDEYVLVVAHLDSVGKAFAGADDNASGIAGLIEVARHTSGLSGQRGLIFMASNGEESGLIGSKYFVREAQTSGLLPKIKFVINMDMIAYNNNGLVDIETNQEFESDARWMATLVQQYTTLRPNITIPAWGSDHVPFLSKKIASILTIEHWNTKTPCYHQACDTPDHLNYDYAREIVRLNVASVILKAQLNLPNR
jgi:hypothetical protein